MKFVFASYVTIPDFKDPAAWLYRIRAYAGIHQALSVHHEVSSIEQIDYKGVHREKKVTYYFPGIAASRKYFPLTLHRYIKNLSPDVVIIHGLHYPFQVIQLRRLLGKKVTVIVQHHAEKPFNGIRKYLQRWAEKSVDAYLFASAEIGHSWINNGNLVAAHKLKEVMELSSVFTPIDKSIARFKTGVSGNRVFLWVGRLNTNKDPLNVIRAFMKFAVIQPDARLYMIYHTTELLKEIKDLLSTYPDHRSIILTGQIPHEELQCWYNSADFILSGSHYEGSGTAICEAMSCGCVPVVTDIPSFRMITNNGACGFLYEAGNEAALVNVLLQTRKTDIAEKRRLSLAYFKSNLSFEAIAARIQTIAGLLVK